jgi:MFS family permease
MALRDRPGRMVRTFRAVLGNPDLRRLALAYLLFGAARWANRVTIFIFAFERGGAAEAGLVAAIMLVPSAVVAPLGSVVGDRIRRDRALALGYAVQTLLVGGIAAALLLAAPIPLVYALAALVSTSATLTRPVQSALFPQFARTPDELTAINAVAGMIYSAVALVGPSVAGLLIAVGGAGLVFAVFAAFLLAATLVVLGLQPLPHPVPTGERRLREAAAGFASVLRHQDQRFVVGLLAGQSVLAGAMDVLLVAITLTLLGLPPSAAGFMAAARGVGGLVGGLWTLGLVGRRDLALPLRQGLFVFGIGTTAMAFSTIPLVTAVLVVIAGTGHDRADTVGRVLLQRVVPDSILCRVFGVVEGLHQGALAVGSALAPLLVAALGVKGAVIAAGLLLPAVVALIGARIRTVDRAAQVPGRELALIRSLNLFAPLPAHTLEDVAGRFVEVATSPGEVVIKEGDAGDRFYVVEAGEVEVSEKGRPLARLGPGKYFGEIALLRDVPRVATVTAATSTTLLALDRVEFLEAVTGDPLSREAAEATVKERLDEDEQN